MRKISILFFFTLIFGATYAQTEVKINPIGLLFGDVSLLAEHGINEKFGLEGVVGLATAKNDFGSEEWKWSAFQIGAAGKFYFNPEKGIDKFYVGPYTRFASGKWKFDDENSQKSTRLALGALAGYKWVTNGGFLFELGLGVGRAFINKIDGEDFDVLLLSDIDFTGRLAVGYRFGGN